MTDICVLFSKREARKILCSDNNLLRNPFIKVEVPKELLAENQQWLDTLKTELTRRTEMQNLLEECLEALSSVITKEDGKAQMRKLVSLSSAIRKPPKLMPELSKSDFHLPLATPFQEMLYAHFSLKNSRAHVFQDALFKEVKESAKEFYDEVSENHEERLLALFR